MVDPMVMGRELANTNGLGQTDVYKRHLVKKRLGQYYTPPEVAEVLTDWAIPDLSTTILDPSFGGCAFLYAALQTLKHRGVKKPGRYLYGVDIDPQARSYLAPLLEAGGTYDQFIIGDFFDVRPSNLSSARVGAVVGNPPYVRHHAIDDAARQKAVDALREVGLKISGRASYWAFFLLHSLRFLRPNGRLAMVLPASFLHADYAAPVRDHVAKSFKRVFMLVLRERIFDDAEEQTIILLAEGFKRPHKQIRCGIVDSVSNLSQTDRTLTRLTRTLKHSNRDSRWLRGLLDSKTLGLFDEISQFPNVVQLGAWATSTIGVVTGNNRFFIISEPMQKRNNIPDEFVAPILARANQLRGLCIHTRDIQRMIESKTDALLLSLNSEPLTRSLEQYLIDGEKNGASNSYKCRSRQPWYCIPSTFAPDAFMDYMTATWPRIVLNYSRATCTNAIHRLVWTKRHPKVELQQIALGSLSTLTQFSAELVGRNYGGGVLKLEPSDVTQLVVPVSTPVNVEKLFSHVDQMLRRGQRQSATKLVDTAFLIKGLGLSQEHVDQLRQGRDKLLNRRIERRSSVKVAKGVIYEKVPPVK